MEKKEIQSKQSCSGCSQPTVVECTVRNCRCRFVSVPDKCVRCIREGQNEQGDFDWAQSLPVERDKTASPIATYLKKDKMRSVMCAFDRDDLDLMDFSSKK
uniref:Uncharacterized protein n=1 Tax=Caenorhabditis japonica TaxID=281687 RepID=A0A8R1DZ38_CAEJA